MLLDLLGDAALIASSAYLFGRNKYITQCVYHPERPQNFLMLVAIFATLSIIGTYHGIPVEDALANTRLVGTLIGGIMGVILGIALSAILCQVMGTTFTISYSAIALGVGFSAAVGILFGWSPAHKASNLSPIDALRRM